MYSDVDYSWGKNLLALFFILLFSAHVNASDIDKWNSQSGKTVRAQTAEKLAQTTYRDIKSTPKPKSDINRVYPEIEMQSKTPEGRTRVVAEAVLDTNKDAVKRDWKKNLKDLAKGNLKGGIAGAAISVGVGKILDATDWILDPKNNQLQRKPKPDEIDPRTYSNRMRYFGGVNCGQYIYDSSVVFPCIIDSIKRSNPNHEINRTEIESDHPRYRYYVYSTKGVDAAFYAFETNPDYDSSTEQQIFIPSDEEIDLAVEDIVNNAANDPKKKAAADAMAKASYGRIWDEEGNLLEIGGEIKDAADDILKDDDPKSSGKTETDPKIKDGTQGESTVKPDNDTNKEYLEDDEGNVVRDPQGQPVKNPNYNPNEKPSYSIKTEYPIFCDWASIVCDWIDWTKKDDSDDDYIDEVEEIEPDLGDLDTSTFQATPGCPSPETFQIIGKTIAISYEPICQFATNWSFVAPLIASFSAALIVIGVGRKGEDSDT